MRAKQILDIRRILGGGRFVFEAVAYDVGKNKKYPTGIKVAYRLIDVENKSLRLLLDNHEPFGFHMHTRLPGSHDERVNLETNDYMAALAIFEKEVRRILRDEKNDY